MGEWAGASLPQDLQVPPSLCSVNKPLLLLSLLKIHAPSLSPHQCPGPKLANLPVCRALRGALSWVLWTHPGRWF